MGILPMQLAAGRRTENGMLPPIPKRKLAPYTHLLSNGNFEVGSLIELLRKRRTIPV